MSINDRNLFAGLNDNVIMVEVKFDGTPTKTYLYKALEQQGLKKGDSVVVPTNSTYSLGEVVAIKSRVKFEPGITYKWVVQRVDFDAYTAIVKQESEFNDAVTQLDRERRRTQIFDDLAGRVGADAVASLREQFKLNKPAIEHRQA